jgi:hypothetical protein
LGFQIRQCSYRSGGTEKQFLLADKTNIEKSLVHRTGTRKLTFRKIERQNSSNNNNNSVKKKKKKKKKKKEKTKTNRRY